MNEWVIEWDITYPIEASNESSTFEVIFGLWLQIYISEHFVNQISVQFELQ